MNKLNTL